MDGYRQTLVGRALADALQELEKEIGDQNARGAGLSIDGDHVFKLFDKAIWEEFRHRQSKDHEVMVPQFTHNKVELEGQLVAFNRFMDDWSIQACVKAKNIKLNHSIADLDFPRQGQELEQKVAVRLKLHQH